MITYSDCALQDRSGLKFSILRACMLPFFLSGFCIHVYHNLHIFLVVCMLQECSIRLIQMMRMNETNLLPFLFSKSLKIESFDCLCRDCAAHSFPSVLTFSVQLLRQLFSFNYIICNIISYNTIQTNFLYKYRLRLLFPQQTNQLIKIHKTHFTSCSQITTSKNLELRVYLYIIFVCGWLAQFGIISSSQCGTNPRLCLRSKNN